MNIIFSVALLSLVLNQLPTLPRSQNGGLSCKTLDSSEVINFAHSQIVLSTGCKRESVYRRQSKMDLRDFVLMHHLQLPFLSQTKISVRTPVKESIDAYEQSSRLFHSEISHNPSDADCEKIEDRVSRQDWVLRELVFANSDAFVGAPRGNSMIHAYVRSGEWIQESRMSRFVGASTYVGSGTMNIHSTIDIRPPITEGWIIPLVDWPASRPNPIEINLVRMTLDPGRPVCWRFYLNTMNGGIETDDP